ncbi:ferrochelatase [soil metagenome]
MTSSQGVAGGKLGVVLFNLGGPDSLEAVKPFLFNLFNDKAIIGLPQPFRGLLARFVSSRREHEAQGNYAFMGGASPLLPETLAQADALAAELDRREPGRPVKIVTAMRYWRPFTADAAKEMAEFAPDDVVILPLYPQFSTTTTGSSLKEWRRRYRGKGRERVVCCFPDEPGLIEAHAKLILGVWDAAGRPADIRLLFSAHGLPEQVIQRGDPYQWQVERTCAVVADRLKADWPGLDWSVCFQSRVGPLKWIGPATPDAISAAVDDGKGVLLVPVAFVSEHVETLVELDRDYAELAEELNCRHYLRAPAVGITGRFVEGLADSVLAAVGRTGVQASCGGRVCPKTFGKCPSTCAA